MAKGAALLQRMPVSMATIKLCSTSGPSHACEVRRERLVLTSTPSMIATEVYKLSSDPGKARLQCLIIPGNPGQAAYYVPFMQDLAAALHGAIDIFAVSHIGHDSFGVVHNQVYSLEQQIHHKCAFLREHMLLPGRPPVLMLGHSIGAYMALHAAKEVEHTSASDPSCPPICKILAVFPFLTVDPGSAKQRMLSAAASVPWLLGAAAQLLGSLPAGLQRWVVSRYASILDPHALACTLGLLRWQTARNAFYLAQHEFRDLAKPPDYHLLEHFGKRVVVICTRSDMWFPHYHWEEMWLKVPTVQAFMVKGQRHDFCVSEALSLTMAQYCAQFVADGHVSANAGR